MITSEQRRQWRIDASCVLGARSHWDSNALEDNERIVALIRALDAADHRIDLLRAEIGHAIRTRDEWEANAGDAEARLETAEAANAELTADLEAGDACGAVGCRALKERDEALAIGWDDAIEEAWASGWLHDYAKSDALARNPYRSGAETGATAAAGGEVARGDVRTLEGRETGEFE